MNQIKRTYLTAAAVGGIVLAGVGVAKANNYEEEVRHTRGDLTCDGQVTAHDTLILMRYIAGLPEIGSECPLPGTIIEIQQ